MVFINHFLGNRSFIAAYGSQNAIDWCFLSDHSEGVGKVLASEDIIIIFSTPMHFLFPSVFWLFFLFHFRFFLPLPARVISAREFVGAGRAAIGYAALVEVLRFHLPRIAPIVLTEN